MNNYRPLWRALVLVLALGAFLAANSIAAEKKQAPKAAKPAAAKNRETPPPVRMGLEPKAMEILKAACDRLAAAQTMRFTAMTTYENPSRFGVPLAYTIQSEVSLQRPDKLKVVSPGDGPASEFLYDGKRMTAFAPDENLVAVTEAPAGIDAALKVAFDAAAIYFPFTDLIVPNPYKDLSEGLILAFYIGQSKVVGGTVTDMVAYATKDVFIQIWIGVEDHLPRMIRAVYRNDTARLRQQMEISDWQLDQAMAKDIFVVSTPAGANPMPFAHPNKQQASAKSPGSTSK